jgi:tyrosine-protein kinase
LDTYSRSFGDYFRVLIARKWFVLAAVILVPAAALAMSLRQSPLYKSSSKVLLNNQNLATSITGIQTAGSAGTAPDRFAQTQADLARVPLVADRTLRAVELTDRTPSQFLANSSVSTSSNADILTFSVRDGDPQLAKRLVNEYAHQFTIYSNQLNTSAIAQALTEAQTKITELEAAGDLSSVLHKSLVEKQQLLTAVEALQTPMAYVRASGAAAKIRPQPVRYGLIGVALGLIVGIGLALLRDALDSRVNDVALIGERLGMPLLARVPAPSRSFKRRLVMLARPDSLDAEPFRVLRKNLEFANATHGAKAILVTSGGEGEGKSTTVANLAIAFARAGRHVVLVDLDVRRPQLHRFFELNDVAGLADYTAGRIDLNTTATPISLNGASADGGRLEVIPIGVTPSAPGEFVASPAVAKTIRELQQRADLVLIDGPPLIGLGDALSLTEAVDGTVVVARLNTVRRQILNEMRRILDICPAVKLGYVVTDAQSERPYSEAYDIAHSYRPSNTGSGHPAQAGNTNTVEGARMDTSV